MEVPVQYKQDDAADIEALVQDIAVVQLADIGLSPLSASASHMHAAPDSDGATLKKPKKRPQPCAAYDADIDASLRTMEKDAGERPSPDYLETVQGGQMNTMTRAWLVRWINEFTRCFDLAPGTLHRAVSYVDRFLSVRALTITDHQLRLVGAVSVFLAAKYEDRYTTRKLNADVIAWYGGFTRSEVLGTECNIIAALSYKMGGPTAYTFVEHFTRYNEGS